MLVGNLWLGLTHIPWAQLLYKVLSHTQAWWRRVKYLIESIIGTEQRKLDHMPEATTPTFSLHGSSFHIIATRRSLQGITFYQLV